MKNRRLWWCAGAVVVGVGAALLTGSGIAAADDGDGGGTHTISQQAKSTATDASSRANAASSLQQDGAETPKTAGKRRGSPLRIVPRIVSALDADLDKAGPARPSSSAPTRASTAVADQTATTTRSPIVSQLVAVVRGMKKPLAHAPPATSPREPGPVATVVLNALSGLGRSPRAEAPAVNGATSAVAVASGVTGVKVGHGKLEIPCGPNGYTARADWYFPTQADGTVQADAVIWLQHGFLLNKRLYTTLATTLAQQTNSVVVAPTLTSNPLACAGCYLSGDAMQQAVASMFVGDRAALNISANAAGYQGTLPDQFVLTGHSAGGGFAAAVAGYTVANGASDQLLGVVMFDGVATDGSLQAALGKLDTPFIPVYQVAAPPQAWNANGATTEVLIMGRPGQFVGVEMVNGSHVDSMLGGRPIADFVLQLITRFSPPGNTQAVYTLSTGWINDMYAGNGPANPQFGIYGQPGQQIILGEAAAIVLPVAAGTAAAAA